jgi:hypothetical protein
VLQIETTTRSELALDELRLHIVPEPRDIERNAALCRLLATRLLGVDAWLGRFAAPREF